MSAPGNLVKCLKTLPRRATIADVSARDGLQSVERVLEPARRVEWVRRLLATGVDEVEVAAFVNPERVPQMAGADIVFSLLSDGERKKAWALVPNMRGLEAARDAGALNVSCIASATETHSRANLGRSIQQVTASFEPMARFAADNGMNARLSLSMAWIDPAEGTVPTAQSAALCRAAREAGFKEITLCDTYGGASPDKIADLINAVADDFAPDAVGLHLHDTFGVASANTLVALTSGVTRFEGSIGGLGGCPFAPGARGNMDTRHLVRLLEGLGVATNADPVELESAEGKLLGMIGRAAPGCAS